MRLFGAWAEENILIKYGGSNRGHGENYVMRPT
jgi:hypothetical protein